MSTADGPLPVVDLERARACRICEGWGTVSTPDGRAYVPCRACQKSPGDRPAAPDADPAPARAEGMTGT